jgi:hypothetical protein
VLEIPNWAIKRYQDLVLKFLWNEKPAKISYKVLISSIENGGLKLQDLKTKIQASKIMWVKNIINMKLISPWKAVLQTYLKFPLEEFTIVNSLHKHYPDIKDKFYNELISTWCKLNFHTPSDCIDIVNELIWNNSNITIDGKTIKYKVWKEAGLKYIQDLLTEEGALASQEYLENRYNLKFKALQYQSLISAIPNTWKSLITNDNQSKHFIIHKKGDILINKEWKTFHDITTKDIYWTLIETTRPVSETKWIEKCNIKFSEEDWAIIYTLPYKLTTDTRLIALQLKITHRIIACNTQLKTWKVNTSDSCDYCGQTDTIAHYLFECKQVRQMWNSIYKWWVTNTEIGIPFTCNEILFGFPNPNDELSDYSCQILYL